MYCDGTYMSGYNIVITINLCIIFVIGGKFIRYKERCSWYIYCDRNLIDLLATNVIK